MSGCYKLLHCKVALLIDILMLIDIFQKIILTQQLKSYSGGGGGGLATSLSFKGLLLP